MVPPSDERINWRSDDQLGPLAGLAEDLQAGVDQVCPLLDGFESDAVGVLRRLEADTVIGDQKLAEDLTQATCKDSAADVVIQRITYLTLV